MKLITKAVAGILIPVLFASAAAAQLTTVAPAVHGTIPQIGFLPCPLDRAVTPMPMPSVGRFSVIPVLPGSPMITPRMDAPVLPSMPIPVRPNALRSPILAAAAKAYVPAKPADVNKEALAAQAQLGKLFDGIKVESRKPVVEPEQRVTLPEADLEREIGAY